jgi:hypothetical protein
VEARLSRTTPAQDEHFEVVDRALRVVIAGVERNLRSGEKLDIPPGTPTKKMWNPNGTLGRVRWKTVSAGRTLDWFREVASLEGTCHVDHRGMSKPLPFVALASRNADTFRLAVRPHLASRAAIATLSA